MEFAIYFQCTKEFTEKSQREIDFPGALSNESMDKASFIVGLFEEDEREKEEDTVKMFDSDYIYKKGYEHGFEQGVKDQKRIHEIDSEGKGNVLPRNPNGKKDACEDAFEQGLEAARRDKGIDGATVSRYEMAVYVNKEMNKLWDGVLLRFDPHIAEIKNALDALSKRVERRMHEQDQKIAECGEQKVKFGEEIEKRIYCLEGYFAKLENKYELFSKSMQDQLDSLKSRQDNLYDHVWKRGIPGLARRISALEEKMRRPNFNPYLEDAIKFTVKHSRNTGDALDEKERIRRIKQIVKSPKKKSKK